MADAESGAPEAQKGEELSLGAQRFAISHYRRILLLPLILPHSLPDDGSGANLPNLEFDALIAALSKSNSWDEKERPPWPTIDVSLTILPI